MRGWNRASFEYHTRPTHPPRRMTQRDVLVPLNRDRLRLLATCTLCGACIALTHVYTTAFIIGVMTHPLGKWLWISMLGVGVVSTLAIFAWSLRTERRYIEKV